MKPLKQKEISDVPMTVDGVDQPVEKHSIEEPELSTDDHSLSYIHHLKRLNAFYQRLGSLIIEFNDIIEHYIKTFK